MLGFLAIFIVAFCGLVAAPLWSIPAGAVALASVSYARHHGLFSRAANLGLQEMIDETLLQSLLNGLMASAMAYGCGAALRYLSLS